MQPWIVGFLVVANMATVVFSNVCFKVSITTSGLRSFLVWQVAGNIAGLGNVLAFTGLLKFIPLNLANSINAGLGFVLVQVLAAGLLFRESISPVQWLGSFLVAGGIVLISFGK